MLTEERKSICRELNARFGATAEERKNLHSLLQYTTLRMPEFGRWYLKNSDELTERMRSANVDWSWVKGLNEAALILWELNEKEAAVWYYATFIFRLTRLYFPEAASQSQEALACLARLNSRLQSAAKLESAGAA